MSKNIDDFYCDFVLSGKVEVDKVRETDNLLAFHHTKPSYPLHIIITPKKHYSKLSDVTDMNLINEIFSIAKEIIIEMNLDDTNFRLITNGGDYQDSKHLHFHLLSAERPK